MNQTSNRYIIAGRKLVLISEGGTRSTHTRAQLERRNRDIVTSKAFAERSFAGLSASTIETLRLNAQGVVLARENGL